MILHRLRHGAAVAVSLLISGCQSMSTESHASPHVLGTASPAGVVHFERHNFGAYIYDTVECRIVYAGVVQREQAPGEPAPPLDPVRDPPHWSGSHAAIRNFPGPIEVRWRTADSPPLSASIDVASIFEDRVALHRVPPDEIKPNVTILDPDIILVVQGRTLSVYMKTPIPTRSLQIPGNKYSDFKDDPILAWSQTY